jgi:hypothetical protein
MSIPQKIMNKVYSIETVDDMLNLLNSSYVNSEKDFHKGMLIQALNKMDKGNYSYTLVEDIGKITDDDFDPYFTPGEMLQYGVFEGKYLNDCVLEFPKEWFIDAINEDSLSPEGADVSCNYFSIKSRMSLSDWRNKGWIPQIEGDPDNRGWFQWYCRYYIGRRIPELDAIQIKRWRSFKRHYGQVRKNCFDLDCRPKQRQALLQWSYNAFVTNED